MEQYDWCGRIRDGRGAGRDGRQGFKIQRFAGTRSFPRNKCGGSLFFDLLKLTFSKA